MVLYKELDIYQIITYKVHYIYEIEYLYLIFC